MILAGVRRPPLIWKSERRQLSSVNEFLPTQLPFRLGRRGRGAKEFLPVFLTQAINEGHTNLDSAAYLSFR